MHGLALRAVQLYVIDLFGADKWSEIVAQAEFEFSEFESMLVYDADVTPATFAAAEHVLKRPLPELLEDLGTYLVSHPNVEALRRLLRFGGVTFEEFLHSLDDLPARAKLAVEDLELPHIELREHAPDRYSLSCESAMEGWGYVLMGILRTMADDYGALAMVEHCGADAGVETLEITLLETGFSEGRDFDLGARTA